ncbi:hypothetical protein ABG768_012552 [Culter alburnus]|uniref:PARP catalytic domain-containing protein n=1 Tax=Culter alburnus TaxID=194366 RepID=A0AAW2AZV9_CULAL
MCPECFFVDIQPNWHRGEQSYIMYHGTTMFNAMRIMSEGFSPSADGMLGPGVYKTWPEHGYDTAWVPPNCGMVKSGLEENCVHDPSRITVLDVMPNLRFW